MAGRKHLTPRQVQKALSEKGIHRDLDTCRNLLNLMKEIAEIAVTTVLKNDNS
ncbi:hypothetical protein AB9P05_04810 [Roseivirga sp. BDSF3-8]|uniref:hypothetical protein n=1 Tax=Roseivirga sp. BDSF3-8 TaxID=3241598 RepID=UPI003531B800